MPFDLSNHVYGALKGICIWHECCLMNLNVVSQNDKGMQMSSKYIDRVLKDTIQKNADQKEFIQAVKEVLTSLAPVLKANPQ